MAAQDLRDALGPKFRGFNTVRISKKALKAVLAQNLEKHKKEYAEARAGYEQQLIQELEKHLVLAKEGKEFRRLVELDEPKDHSGSYEQVIAICDYSLDEEFEISSHEFARYVRDEWEWTEEFKNVSKVYSSHSTSLR